MQEGHMGCKERVIQLLENSYLKMVIVLANFVIMLMIINTNNKLITGVDMIKRDMVLVGILSSVCLVEVVLTFCVLPWKYIATKRLVIVIEIVLLLLTALAYYSMSYWTFRSVRFGMRDFEMIFVLRCLRIGTFLKEIKEFRIIYEFCFKLTKPMCVMFAALYFCFYCFAVFGNIWWGGLVTTESAQTQNGGIPGLYYLMNFNDLACGIVTLFAFMVVNNWTIIVQIYIDITGS
jgi:hypothetical protein